MFHRFPFFYHLRRHQEATKEDEEEEGGSERESKESPTFCFLNPPHCSKILLPLFLFCFPSRSDRPCQLTIALPAFSIRCLMRLSVKNLVFFFAVVFLRFLSSGVLTPSVLDSSVEGEPWLVNAAAVVSCSPSSSYPHQFSLSAAPVIQVCDAENESGLRSLSNDLVPFRKALTSLGKRSILSLDENSRKKVSYKVKEAR
ncbi:uncharacterized protein LOC121980523 isoform X1 [Zingiber officinale]|uniref:uncharacterized protein LOC121980523 isoform X1 n=1 Tax=Zingiber officinale TaxID=94328 RepID=UPI001C4BBA0E|nr:uncharacterized protein LOC121980523 isoform X1 [Zingiber officinale]